MKAYCIFCKTGSEKTVAESINQFDDNILAIAPTRTLKQKFGGVWKDVERILLPGYIFVFSDEELTSSFRENVAKIYKVLEYQSGLRSLTGDDYEYSIWIYNNGGNIKPSGILSEGTSIRVVEGPLADGFGKIVKLDRHKRKAWVEFDFDGQKRTVALSAEFISAED